MKYLLIAIAFVGGSAMACPDGAKDAAAAAPVSAKVAVATKAKPASVAAVSKKSVTKVAVKTTAGEPRKSASL